ncbi:hypothetical protein [Kutzneria sp. CA-103260]|uniref:hypothetical protein n=1 Tax=Kutzneria sp. CA-103260 TaxID=2802641 RepID=UPI001BA6B968|nr:hypothetical protein [Kutzneria sp. CA-103260]
MTFDQPAPGDDDVIELLQRRDGVPTEVVLRDGNTLTVLNIAWGYDIGDEYAHVTTNFSPPAEGIEIDFFCTDTVAAIVDPETGTTLLSAVADPLPAGQAPERRSGRDLSQIERIWQDGRLPIVDGVFFVDGRSYAVDVADSALHVVGQVDLAEDPEWLTSIDITREAPAPGGFVCAGEGSHGSEGFFARLDGDKRLVWVCYLSESNPFDQLALTGNTLTVSSTSGVVITVDLDEPV